MTMNTPQCQLQNAQYYEEVDATIKPKDAKLKFTPRLLLVEDCPDTQLLLSHLLEELGLDITVVGDAKECLESFLLAQKLDKAFDAVLLDIGLPGLDGYDLTKILRQSQQQLPIIAITATPSLNKRCESMHSGCDAFLAKRNIHETILPTLKTLLR